MPDNDLGRDHTELNAEVAARRVPELVREYNKLRETQAPGYERTASMTRVAKELLRRPHY